MSEPLTGCVSHAEIQDKAAPAEIFEKQECWSILKIKLFYVKISWWNRTQVQV